MPANHQRETVHILSEMRLEKYGKIRCFYLPISVMGNLFELSGGVSYILKTLLGEADYKFSLGQHSYLSCPNDHYHGM